MELHTGGRNCDDNWNVVVRLRELDSYEQDICKMKRVVHIAKDNKLGSSINIRRLEKAEESN